jgi:hypothetical protein
MILTGRRLTEMRQETRMKLDPRKTIRIHIAMLRKSRSAMIAKFEKFVDSTDAVGRSELQSWLELSEWKDLILF